MMTMTSKEAKNKFGTLLDDAQTKGPVAVTRNNRRAVVVVSADRYEQLEALEDEVLCARARAAVENGFAGVEKTAAFIREALSAES